MPSDANCAEADVRHEIRVPVLVMWNERPMRTAVVGTVTDASSGNITLKLPVQVAVQDELLIEVQSPAPGVQLSLLGRVQTARSTADGECLVRYIPITHLTPRQLRLIQSIQPSGQ